MSKKITTLFILFCILAISLAACGSAENLTQAAPAEAQATAVPTQALVAATQPANSASVAYPLVETGQGNCYDADGAAINCPAKGEAFYGQDAQFTGNAFSFTNNGDGTISDNVTGLMWQKAPNADNLGWQRAIDYCDSLEFANQSDWRTPSLKEIFSISDFSQGWPYLDTTYFDLSGADVSKAEQYWSNNHYAGSTVEGRTEAAFGVNHGTGHIKAYSASAGPMGKHVRCVRGDTYGVNQLVNNGDGTISDQATGLMWSQADSGLGMDRVHGAGLCPDSECHQLPRSQRLAATECQGTPEHCGLHPSAGRDESCQ